MAGLLDFVANDPEARLGISLLAAGSPRYGRGLLGMLETNDRTKQGDLQRQLLQSQITENQAQAEMRSQQLALAQQKQQALGGMLGGAGAGNLRDLTIDQVASLKASHGIDLTDQWKLAQTGIAQDAGKYYRNGNQTIYTPTLPEGATINTSTREVSLLPGYANAIGATKGSEAAAVEAARFPYAVGTDRARQTLAAELDPVKTYNSQSGRDEFVSRAVIARPQAQYSGAGYAGGSAAAAAPEQVQIISSELNRLPANHPDRPALLREIQRLGGVPMAAQQQQGNYAAGPTAAEAAQNEAKRVQAVEQVKADVTPTATKLAAVDTARDALGVINQALTHPGLKTATGLQGSVDPRNYIAGTDATNFRVMMDQIKGGVFLDAFKDLKGGGAITETEGAKAEAARARINRAQSPDEFVKGLNDYRAIIQRGLERAEAKAGGQPPQGGASGSWGAPSKGGFRIIGVQ